MQSNKHRSQRSRARTSLGLGLGLHPPLLVCVHFLDQLSRHLQLWRPFLSELQQEGGAGTHVEAERRGAGGRAWGGDREREKEALQPYPLQPYTPIELRRSPTIRQAAVVITSQSSQRNKRQRGQNLSKT